MDTVPFAVYDAFSDVLFGGSQAGIVTGSKGITADSRAQIAREVGAPATAFVDSCSGNSITAQFFSTVMELPMCGHGTICLMTRMLESGTLAWNNGNKIDVDLHLPSDTASVEISRRDDGRALVMLDVQPPSFSQKKLDDKRLANLLGLEPGDYYRGRPVETATADFIHLIVPVKGLEVMRRIVPDFGGLTRFCHEHEIETVAVFCTEVVRANNTIHVRDFCPAVGVSESAAAGTTNSAISSYLVRHWIVQQNGDGQVTVLAEQGHEIGRPSSIRSVLTIRDGKIKRVQVGGVATKVMDGQLYLPLQYR